MRSPNDRNTRRGTGIHSRHTAPVPEGGQNALPVGHRIGEFEIADLIGEGGFGIVYLAYDHSLHRRVALKEYMPSSFASRTRNLQVAVKEGNYAEAFQAGLRSFVNEARLLAQFDSPSLVKVYRFWEANGTAYMVMPYYEGITLRQALKEHKITPTEQWVREFLANLFDAIETIHRVQCFHRDIAPDNILLLKDGRPLLLDFGAARRVIEDLTHSPTAILKPGFAPIEQYAKISGMRQGAWTDVYALAAVVYFLITGARPPPAVMRMLDDDMVPAREAGKGRYSDAFLATIDKALAVRPEQRIQSMSELRRAFAESDALSSATTAPDTPVARQEDPERTRINTLAGSWSKAVPQYSAPSAAGTMNAANATNATNAMNVINNARQDHPAPDYRATYPPLNLPIESTAKEPPRVPEGQAGFQSQRAPQAETRREPWLSGPKVRVADERPHPATTGTQYASAPTFMADNRWARLAAMHGVTPQGLAIVLVSAGISLGVYLGAQQFLLKSPTRVAKEPADRTLQGPPSGRSNEDTAQVKLAQRSVPNASRQSAEERAGLPANAALPPPMSSPRSPQAVSASDAGALAMASPRSSNGSSGSSGLAGDGGTSAPARGLTEKELWRTSRASNDARDYANYLVEFPKGRHAADARAWLKRDAARQSLAESGPPPTSTVDSSSSAAAAGSTARESGDERDWASTAARNQPGAYEGYLARHPQGRHAADAIGKLALLKPATRNADADKTLAPPSESAATTARPQAAASDEKKRTEAGTESASPSVAVAAPANAGPSAPKLRPEQSASSLATAKSPGASPRTMTDPGTKNFIQLNDQTVRGEFSVEPVTGAISGRVHIAWTNGNQFDGTLVHGIKEGDGQFAWTNGQRYRGEWSHDKPNGKGTIWFADGGRYQGEVRDGEPNGVGAMAFPKSDHYEGRFLAGKPHGHGKMQFHNGDRYEGGWANGLKQGQGRMTWASGDYWEGEFKADRMTENGKLVRLDKSGTERQATGSNSGNVSGAVTQAETHTGDAKP